MTRQVLAAAWKCAGCGKPYPDRKGICDCVTGCVFAMVGDEMHHHVKIEGHGENAMTVNELSELEDLCQTFSEWLKNGRRGKPLEEFRMDDLRRLVLRADQARREVASATPGTPAYLK